MLKDETTELEQMRKMLQNSSQWVGSTREEREVVHHKQCPEYWIEKVPCQIQTGYEYYLFNQTDSWPDWYDINLYHDQTILASIGGINLDGGRCFSSTPETRFFLLRTVVFPLCTNVLFREVSVLPSMNFSIRGWNGTNNMPMTVLRNVFCFLEIRKNSVILRNMYN